MVNNHSTLGTPRIVIDLYNIVTNLPWVGVELDAMRCEHKRCTAQYTHKYPMGAPQGLQGKYPFVRFCMTLARLKQISQITL